MTGFPTEKRALQIAVAVAAGVPVSAGMWGVLAGVGAPGAFADSQYRYLSGLLVGVGFAFWAMVPWIERRRWPFRALGAIVVIGGMARLGAALASGASQAIWAALAMELIVTPILVLWRERVERMDPGAPASYAGPWG
jgi:tetrahydromethanopterin S-methyltransferase subunit E